MQRFSVNTFSQYSAINPKPQKLEPSSGSQALVVYREYVRGHRPLNTARLRPTSSTLSRPKSLKTKSAETSSSEKRGVLGLEFLSTTVKVRGRAQIRSKLSARRLSRETTDENPRDLSTARKTFPPLTRRPVKAKKPESRSSQVSVFGVLCGPAVCTGVRFVPLAVFCTGPLLGAAGRRRPGGQAGRAGPRADPLDYIPEKNLSRM